MMIIIIVAAVFLSLLSLESLLYIILMQYFIVHYQYDFIHTYSF